LTQPLVECEIFTAVNKSFLLRVLPFLVWCIFPAQAQRLSPLAAAPDWTRLEVFQETTTRAEFVRLLDTVFAPNGAWAG
jgi:hypothetical protein